MVDGRVVEQMVMFPFEFIAPTEIEIEETASGVALIKGVLLREGTSKNGNLYTISEMEKIAKQAEGMPIYVGTTTKVDPNYGIARKGMHNNTTPNKVGKILSATFDKTKRVIRYIAQILNTVVHPKIIEEVKAGWGISIGGVCTKARLVIDGVGRVLTKVLGMKLNHVQLIPPNVIRGQDEAIVSEVQIQETMIIYETIPEQEHEKVIINLNIDPFYGINIS